MSNLKLQKAQGNCFKMLSVAIEEGSVFLALTGPKGCGKRVVLEAVLTNRRDRALRCIRITDPDKVTAAQAKQVERIVYDEAGKIENNEQHVVLLVEDAHVSSRELLQCLSSIALVREPKRRIPQLLLVGRPELWDRLAEEEFQQLARRIAIRATLPGIASDVDLSKLVDNEDT